ncbi:MAG: phosphate ABC transporter substrate-binding protein [Sphingomonas sp.]|nr:phosphate ABC transporter substrate-binding protein [Sphingomonas sp.]|tara:strand:+ start:54 stop:464 length:411 start_codon:yes stop_codon:yes gene_type:complete
MKKLLIGAALSISISTAALAEIAVIVSHDNTQNLAQSDIERIYTGKSTRYPNGDEVEAYNLKSGAVVDTFNTSLLKRSTAQMNAYWSKLIFTGKGKPLKAVDSEQDMINAIAANPVAIGYVDASSVTNNVKVITTL